MKCNIEIVFSPPRPDLEGLGRPDSGGFIYRIRNEKDILHLAGSVRTMDPLRALKRAQTVSKMNGYTHWRSLNAGGPYHLMNDMS